MCRLHSQVQSSVSAVAAGSFVVHIPPRWVSVTHNWCPNDTPRRALAVAVYNAVYCALSCPVTITVQQVPTSSRRRPLAYSMTRSAAVIPLQRKTSHQLLVAVLRATQIRFNAATTTTTHHRRRHRSFIKAMLFTHAIFSKRSPVLTAP